MSKGTLCKNSMHICSGYSPIGGDSALGVGADVGEGPAAIVARRQNTIDAWDQPARAARATSIPVGSRIFHQKFGYGTVKNVDDDKLDIEFDKAGTKMVLESFLQPV